MNIVVLKINEKTFNLCAGNIYVIGRNSCSYDNDVYLNEESIDCKHAAIDLRKNRINIVDMHSTSGTYVDDIQLDKLNPQVLLKSCNLKFGNVSGSLIISNNCLNEFNESNKEVEANSSSTSNVINCSPNIAGSKSNARYIPNKLQNIPSISIENNISLVQGPVEKQHNSHLFSPDEEEIDMVIPETPELFDKTNNHSEHFRICTQEFNYMGDSSKDSECSDIYPVFDQNQLDSIKIIANDSGTRNNKNDDVNINTPDLSETFSDISRKRLSTILSMSDMSSTLDSDLDYLERENDVESNTLKTPEVIENKKRGNRLTSKLTTERPLRTKRNKLPSSMHSSQESHSILSRFESDLSINFGNRTLRRKLKVIFTKIDPKDYMDSIRSLGLQIVKDPRSADILITNNIKRTYKFLIALVRGIPVVSINWLQSSISDKTISMSFEDYYVTDKKMEKQFKFNLSTSIKLAQNRKLFDGYQFLMTANIKPAPKEMKDIIECGGGKVLQKVPSTKDNLEDDLVLISNVEDQKLRSQYKKLDHIKIVQDEGILISILQQKIQFEKYLLS